MKSITLAAAALCASTTLAAAEEKVQFTYSGRISIESISEGEGNAQFAYGNLDAGVRWPTTSGMKLGFDLGYEAINAFNDDVNYLTSSYLTATAVLDTSYGNFSAGTQKNVIDKYFSMPALGGSEILKLEMAVFTGDIFRVFRLEGDGNIYGVRYDGQMGQVAFGASVNQIENNDVTGASGSIEQIAGKYDGGNWSISLAATQFGFDDISANVFNLEVQGERGKFAGGVIVSKSNMFFNSGYVVTTNAFISYDFNDQIKANGQILHVDDYDYGSLNAYSLTLSYNHPSGAFIEAGVVRHNSYGVSDENDLNVSLGYTF